MLKEISLTGKQKRYLRALGNTMDPVIQVGKDGIVPGTVQQADDALEARELIKIRVLNNCAEDKKEVAIALSEQSGAAMVQVVGNTFLLYRPSAKNPRIELPS
ncbi:MAG: ribosome assembly RNA-binding protein YhbY [Firmicutes bacterium HGW-Firmicutes-14]|nr:MAG: ribosome assembly RNA-binding protein YhbY [Firmicutes bacterium HGW-Firmicutes-14]